MVTVSISVTEPVTTVTPLTVLSLKLPLLTKRTLYELAGTPLIKKYPVVVSAFVLKVSMPLIAFISDFARVGNAYPSIPPLVAFVKVRIVEF